LTQDTFRLGRSGGGRGAVTVVVVAARDSDKAEDRQQR
jgi:hypothetical protein